MNGIVRRVVTGHSPAGKAIIVSDGPVPVVRHAPLRPGYQMNEVWVTYSMPAIIDRVGIGRLSLAVSMRGPEGLATGAASRTPGTMATREDTASQSGSGESSMKRDCKTASSTSWPESWKIRKQNP